MKQRYLELAREACGKFKVGADPCLFLDEFLRWNDWTSEEYRVFEPSAERVKSLQDMAQGRQPNGQGSTGATGQKRKLEQVRKHEDVMYGHLVNALDGYPLSDIKADLKPPNALETKFSKFTGHKDYDAGGIGTDVFQYRKDHDSAYKETNFAASLTHVEIKGGLSQDCFRDGPFKDDSTCPWEKDTEEGKHVRGQISAYAANSMHMTFRSHFFTILVAGSTMRFIRWDRRGAIVTRAIPYDEEHKLVFAFYARFAQLTPRQRGDHPNLQTIDPNPTDEKGKKILEDAQYALTKMSAEVRDTLYLGEYPFAARASKKGSPDARAEVKPSDLLQMAVQFPGQDKQRHLFVSPPEFSWSCISPFSRATRRCFAYDCETKQVYFMKDYWRENSERTLPEAEIYSILKKKGIPNVAEMVMGGDVLDFVTLWQEKRFNFPYTSYPEELDAKLRQPLFGHCLFLNTIGRNLRTFKTGRNLFSCVADAVEALEAALREARILHRDISANNIMIQSVNGDDHGLLIDWDHCIMVDRSGGGIPRGERTGTWQFMSVQLLDNTKLSPPTHTILDDRESVLWVLLYMTYRYLPTNATPRQLYDALSGGFNQVTVINGKEGAPDKDGALFKLARGERKFRCDIKELDKVLMEVARAFASRYQDVSEKRRRQFRNLQKSEDDSELWDDWWDILGSQYIENDTWLLQTLRDGARNIPLPRLSADGTPGQDFHKNKLSFSDGASLRRTQTYITRIESWPFVKLGWDASSYAPGNKNKKQKTEETHDDGSTESGYATGDGVSPGMAPTSGNGRILSLRGPGTSSNMDTLDEEDEEPAMDT